MSIYEEFGWRGLLYQTSEGVEEALGAGQLSVYVGFDPSADSLHIGSLLPLMTLARMQRAGHVPIGLIGGGTGLIGDPSGKSQERILLSVEDVQRNLAGIRAQVERFLDFEAAGNQAVLIDNAEWLTKISFMEFLRDVGKHFTVNAMLAKETVKRRVASEEGISFTEFSYMLLQAYDYLVLHDRFGCTLQIGGSDQWGNVTAGMDLIRRLRGAKAYGLTFPLVTTATGAKFGKTEAGTIWLDAGRTSPYRFFQFWLNTNDQDVIPYLKYFTWLGHDEIRDLEQTVDAAPEKREAQRTLGELVTTMLHGKEALERAVHASAVLFSEEIVELQADEVLDIFEDVPAITIPADELAGDGMKAAELMARAGVTASKGEARRLIKGGGASLNNRRLADPEYSVTRKDAIDGRLLVLRKGRKSYFLVKLS